MAEGVAAVITAFPYLLQGSLVTVAVVLGAMGGFIYLGEKATPGKLIGLLAIVAGCCLIKMA